MKNILIILGIIITLIFSSCSKINPNSTNADSTEILQEQKYLADKIDGKASIENLTVDKGQIEFNIKNLTSDNKLVSAYLEYVRDDGDEQMLKLPLDADLINLKPGKLSKKLNFRPNVFLGSKGHVKIIKLEYSDAKDNYQQE